MREEVFQKYILKAFRYAKISSELNTVVSKLIIFN